ncbi:MAG: S4 domain-containing protein, partial [Bacteroidota bacterium]
MADNSISLNKYISSTGICSRREADRWIEAGRVQLNGQKAQKGNRVAPGDRVLVDGKPLRKKPKPIYIALHKPPGITSTTDRRDKDNIIDFVGHPQRIFPIGRLDKPSTGLILLTNDGDIV